MTDRLPNHKKGVISAIYDVVDEGDKATVVGGGMGVTSTHLAQAGASIVAYEAAGEMLSVPRETWEIAGVQEQIDLHHRLVGEGIKVNDGEMGKPLPPNNLPTEDILLLDCEGAEKSILSSLEDWPKSVIVETHPAQGVPSSVPRELLTKQGYQIEVREYEPGDDKKEVLIGHLQ